MINKFAVQHERDVIPDPIYRKLSLVLRAMGPSGRPNDSVFMGMMPTPQLQQRPTAPQIRQPGVNQQYQARPQPAGVPMGGQYPFPQGQPSIPRQDMLAMEAGMPMGPSLYEVGEPQVGRYSQREREARIARYRQKRADRCFTKKIKYESRKILADRRPRFKGRFARATDDDQIHVDGQDSTVLGSGTIAQADGHDDHGAWGQTSADTAQPEHADATQ